ncbi:ABC transporter ATP-binding protein [Cohnella boryungensis]|uniref:ABC transporter ATP-binding protein n=1 Tax=Cohnella boryungensis TaxID=768479 RepID=A0ABV8SBW1_9BACL
MRYAIETHDLRKSFGTYEAVQGVDLTVRQGEIFALLGPNGAGKTTVIRMLTTLLRPDGGSARVLGCDVATDAGQVRRRIGITGQSAALDEGLTGRQNLLLFAGLSGHSLKEARAMAAELLDSFGLAEAGDRTVSAYSGGMRRRLDLAAGLLSQPEVLFLDEPTTGLDPQSRYELWETVRRLAKQGTTVLLTTQYLEEADRLADRIAFISQGRIIASGTPEQLKASTGGKTLTIRLGAGSDPASVCRLLANEHGLIGQPSEDGTSVKAAVQHAASAHAAIGALLVSPATIDDFMLSDPSLDDVFFALTAARGKGETSP